MAKEKLTFLFENLSQLRDLYKEYPKMIVKGATLIDKDVLNSCQICVPMNGDVEYIQMEEKQKEFLIGKIIAIFESLELDLPD